ncbi:MAG: protein O-mannosyl-transferase family [Chloroflexia bacterium]
MPILTKRASLPDNEPTIAQSGPTSNARGWLPGLLASAVVAVAAFILYARTLAPDVLVGDSGEFQFTGAILGIPHPTGYPLYTLLGWVWSLLPFGNVAYRINLSSAFYMALASGMVTLLAWRLTSPPAPLPNTVILSAAKNLWVAAASLLAGLLFAVSGTVWAQAVVARSYALNAALVAACLLALLVWWQTGRRAAFLAVPLLVGLSLAHHGTTILLLPGYALLTLAAEWHWSRTEAWRARLRRWALGAAMFALGLSPYLLLAYRFVFGYTYYWGNPRTWGDVLFLARGGPFAGQIFSYPLTLSSQLERLGFGLDQLARQFGMVGVVFGLAGLLRLLVDRRTWVIGCALALLLLANFVFAVNYGIVGQIYLIPTYLFWALFIAAAATWPFTLADRAARPSFRRVATGAALSALVAAVVVVPAALVADRFSAEDRSGDTQIGTMARQTLAQAETGAHIYVDWESLCVFRYYRFVEYRRLDLTLYSENPGDWDAKIAEDLAAGRAAYVGGFAGPDPPAPVRAHYILARVGLVYKVLGRLP